MGHKNGSSSKGLLLVSLMMALAVALCFIVYANTQQPAPPVITETLDHALDTTAATSELPTTTTAAAPVLSPFEVSSGDAPFIHLPDRVSPYYIVVFLKSQTTAVYARGEDNCYSRTEHVFTCSTGAEGHSTRCGLHAIYRRYRWRALVGDVYGQYATGFTNSYLFHSVPYFAEDAAQLDTDGYRALGTPASHGCVRLCVRDARWIYENCPDGTQVYVVDEAGPMGEAVPPLEDGASWDPTDTEFIATMQ
ncbi:MAG: L,D-transpeptidase [Ruminococcaceae bacterium]|nr:L,D-transpeptidase [Oscillospiraceae bacterium]